MTEREQIAVLRAALESTVKFYELWLGHGCNRMPTIKLGMAPVSQNAMEALLAQAKDALGKV